MKSIKSPIRYGAHLGHLKSSANPKMTHYLIENSSVPSNWINPAQIQQQLSTVRKLIDEIVNRKGYVLVSPSQKTSRHYEMTKWFIEKGPHSLLGKQVPAGIFTNTGQFEGLDMVTKKTPSAVFLFDVGQTVFIREANRLGLATIGIVDSNQNPTGLTYVIPGNDDSLESLYFYLSYLFGPRS